MIIKRDDRILDARYLSQEGNAGTRWWSAMRGRNKLSVFNGSVVTSEVTLAGRPGQLVFSNLLSVLSPRDEILGAQYIVADFTVLGDTKNEFSVTMDSGSFVNDGWQIGYPYTTFLSITGTPSVSINVARLYERVAGVNTGRSVSVAAYYTAVGGTGVNTINLVVPLRALMAAVLVTYGVSLSTVYFNFTSSMPSTSTATSQARSFRPSNSSTGGDSLGIACGPTVQTTGLINTFVTVIGGVLSKYDPTFLTCPM